MKEKLINAMREHFGADARRIDHALSVLGFAEELIAREGGDPGIVVPAAILHDTGIKPAEKKYGSSAGHYQEKEGPPVARKILLKLGYGKEETEEICTIIAHHHSPGKVTTLNFQLLYEADWLVNLGDDFAGLDPEKKKRLIEKNFATETGKALALSLHT